MGLDLAPGEVCRDGGSVSVSEREQNCYNGNARYSIGAVAREESLVDVQIDLGSALTFICRARCTSGECGMFGSSYILEVLSNEFF